MSLPESWPCFSAETALGAAYWRSDTSKSLTLELFELLDKEDFVTYDLVRHALFDDYI
jgi:hypothetical protein